MVIGSDNVQMQEETRMVNIEVSTTLAEAVDAFPQLVREFERRVPN